MGTLTEEEHARLDRLALGLRMLGSLPLPWQQRCSALHEHPRLILETLLMGKQLRAASQVQKMYLGCNWSVRDKYLYQSCLLTQLAFGRTWSLTKFNWLFWIHYQ